MFYSTNLRKRKFDKSMDMEKFPPEKNKPIQSETIFKAVTRMDPSFKNKKNPLQKKFARRFALLAFCFTLIIAGGGYLLWTYLPFTDEKEETNSQQASIHQGPLLPVENPRPMDLYAASFSPVASGQATVSLILLGVGQFPDLTQQALEQLPPEITFAISPLSPHSKEWAEKAHLKQHEILVTLGLQPDNYPSNDPGPNTLLTGLDWEKNLRRFIWSLEQVPMAVGVTHDTGDYFTTKEASLRPIIQEVRRSGLFFLDTLLSPDSLVSEISKEEQSPYAVTYYFCSENPFLVERNLRNLESLAQQKGHVIAVAVLTPVLLQKLVEWSKDIKEKNISLLPITALFKLNILKDPTKANVKRS